MTARADVLILEDNPTELDAIASLTQASGLVTMATRSPNQALRLLRVNDPTLAIVDWNMRLSPEAALTAASVLKTLSREHPDTFTIVYAARAGTDMDLQEQIAAAHPGAITHDKRQGLPSLLARVRSLLQRKVGDLRIDRATVVHLPTGERYQNKWAIRLLCGYPSAVLAVRNSAAYMSMYRFSRWLEETGSNVSMVSEGAAFYRLEVAGAARSTGAAQRR